MSLSDEAIAKILLRNKDMAVHLFDYPPGVALEQNRGAVASHSVGPLAAPALLYAHVPFCHAICKFCNVYKERHPGPKRLAAYLDALLAEAREVSRQVQGTRFAAAYVGGGTPTALTEGQLDVLLGELRRLFKLGDGMPFEIDATPASLTPAKVAVLLRRGVSHLSMGIQSLEAGVLCAIGRQSHNGSLPRLSRILAGTGLKVHFDFIVGLPGETLASVRGAIDRVVCDFAPASLSVNAYDHTGDTGFAQDGVGLDFPGPIVRRRMRRAVKALQTYIRVRHDLRRGPTHYFPRVRDGAGVVGIGAGAYGYLPHVIAYRNLPYGDYLRSGFRVKKIHRMTPDEERRRFIIHKISDPNLFAGYRMRFGTRLEKDFPGPHVELMGRGHVHRPGRPERFVFPDREDERAAAVRFYSAAVLACYER
ncbi:MAG: hypothetical protein A2V88_10525 [Elusimicrobia bacterium RBG_16_66_12]|nr:MAG: hypothetical protein A2V88_10525 [Elusimicrobia bacterium RBG_16_66_12]